MYQQLVEEEKVCRKVTCLCLVQHMCYHQMFQPEHATPKYGDLWQMAKSFFLFFIVQSEFCDGNTIMPIGKKVHWNTSKLAENIILDWYTVRNVRSRVRGRTVWWLLTETILVFYWTRERMWESWFKFLLLHKVSALPWANPFSALLGGHSSTGRIKNILSTSLHVREYIHWILRCLDIRGLKNSFFSSL